MPMLPLFPLGLVVFPGQELKLHIFEPRYKQLIRDCEREGLTFGIPPVIDNQLSGYGTEVELLRVDKLHPNGEMDITTLGLWPIRLRSFDQIMPGKLYPGGDVDRMHETVENDPLLQRQVLDALEQLESALGLHRDEPFDLEDMESYTLGHQVGLTIQQQVELLSIEEETGRLSFILDHLEQITPVVIETERMKSRARMNGHFKNLLPPDY